MAAKREAVEAFSTRRRPEIQRELLHIPLHFPNPQKFNSRNLLEKLVSAVGIEPTTY
jgi:hypothetical protein